MFVVATSQRHSHSTASFVGGALCGAAVSALGHYLLQRRCNRPQDPETDPVPAHTIVWSCIGGALKAAQMYIGDRLDLYSTLRDACAEPGSSVTAKGLAQMTGYHVRWLEEWLAQQAAMGVLVLLPKNSNSEKRNIDDTDYVEELRYRIPQATAEVLANPDSPEYDISLISCIPSLVHRAKTMLPEAFSTGMGRPYDETEVANGIDRHHRIEIRDVLLPQILPQVQGGAVHQALLAGCRVADLGCGAGNLVMAMARQYPKSRIDGYEISQQALSIGATRIAKAVLKNAFLVDANEDPMGNHEDEYDVLMTFDVLHDAPNPSELIRQARAALKPGGVWILGDIAGKASVRENITNNASAGVQLAFSTCLCMACSLSTKDGAGLGTLGFNVPVAEKMLKEGGFHSVRVIMETSKNTRWFEVM